MDNAAGEAVAGIGALVYLFLLILTVIGAWKMYSKAGEPGWAVLIPIYNLYVLCKVAGKPGWWIILFLIPIVNIIITILVSLGLAEKFGKTALFGILAWIFPFICYPILGFGDAEYEG